MATHTNSNMNSAIANTYREAEALEAQADYEALKGGNAADYRTRVLYAEATRLRAEARELEEEYIEGVWS
jgi:hypothetical protein